MVVFRRTEGDTSASISLSLGHSRGVRLGSVGHRISLSSSPAWIKIAVVIVWLFVLIASALLLGNMKSGAGEERREFQHVLRNDILYLAIALIPVTALCALIVHDTDMGIQRNIRQNWLLCELTAFTVVGISIEQFWRLRRTWQLWGVLLAYAALHFSIGVPALTRLDRIRYGDISMIAAPELIVVSFVLYRIEQRQALREGQ